MESKKCGVLYSFSVQVMIEKVVCVKAFTRGRNQKIT
jgi:hypothetical protein